MNKSLSTAFAAFIAAAGLAPFAACLSGVIYVWRTSIYLGYWPTYGQPDPKTLPQSFDPAMSFYRSIPWVALLLVASTITIVFHRMKYQEFKIPIAVLLVFLMSACTLALVWADPRGVFSWIFD